MNHETKEKRSSREEFKKDGKSGLLSGNDYDQQLLARLKDGDEEAFMAIFNRWSRPLQRFILNITGSAQDAEDISQETFTTLWLKRDSIDLTKKIQTYIFLIAKQITWKQLRSKKRRDEFLSSAGYEVGSAVSTDELIIAKEVEMLTEYAIANMPARTRQIYQLYYKENLSYEQIATRLNITTGNVKSQIYQARQTLKDVLAVVAVLFFYH